MTNDLNHLARRMHKIAAGVNTAIDLTVKDGATLTLHELAAETPVDVGMARSNWAVGLGGGFMGTARHAFNPYKSRWRPPGLHPGGSKGERANYQATIALGRSKIRLRKPDQDVYITNHLPYIVPLNKGHSKQSRPGWVNRAVAKAANQLVSRAVTHLRKALR